MAQSVIRPDRHWHAWNRRYSRHGLRRLALVDDRELCAAENWCNDALHRPTWNLGDPPSPLARDEVLADYLRDVFVECDGELVLLDAFDLALAEHMMVHGVAN